MKKTFAVISFLLIFLSVSTVSMAMMEGQEPSGGAILFDVAIVRPLGIASIALGSAIFVIGLPFTIPSRSVKFSAKKLIAEPFEYTFRRPVGEMDGRGAYGD